MCEFVCVLQYNPVKLASFIFNFKNGDILVLGLSVNIFIPNEPVVTGKEKLNKKTWGKKKLEMSQTQKETRPYLGHWILWLKIPFFNYQKSAIVKPKVYYSSKIKFSVFKFSTDLLMETGVQDCAADEVLSHCWTACVSSSPMLFVSQFLSVYLGWSYRSFAGVSGFLVIGKVRSRTSSKIR